MKKRPVLSLLNSVLKPFGFVLPSLLLLSILGQFIRPSYFVLFQWLGLLFLPLVVMNLFLLFFWGIQRRRLALLPLFAMLLNFFSFLKIVQFRWQSPSFQVGDSTLLTLDVASYNVRSFQMDYGGSSLQNVADWVREKNVDVVCLQEVPCVMPKSILVDAFSFMPYMIVAPKRTGELSVVVFSRFPVQSAVSVSFPERANCALISNLNINGKIIRLLTCHLQTTNWNQLKGEKNVDRFSFGRNIKRWLMSESVISRNYLYREAQSDYLKKKIENSSLPTIVCGDFNATPFSYTYRTMKGKLADSFQECGTGYAFTYRFLYQMLRIDYLFYSQHDFTALHYESPELQYSDHKPIIVKLALKKKRLFQ